MNQIGVLGFQGSVEEHLQMLASLKIKAIQVNSLTTLSEVDGIIIPGGESTTFLKIYISANFMNHSYKKLKRGFPLWRHAPG